LGYPIKRKVAELVVADSHSEFAAHTVPHDAEERGVMREDLFKEGLALKCLCQIRN
jgi:hypothetical protein